MHRTLLARPYAADMVNQALEETVSAAIHALQGPKYGIGDALDQVPHVAGLYAIWADAGTWQMLGLKAPPPPKPLYVGKAERSLVSRDLKTHFRTGKTGSSTVRRSFAALLRDSLDLHAVPRNLVRPERPANFGLPPQEDERLTQWMHESLTLATWAREGEQVLDEIQTAVLAHWQPPLNLSKVAQASRRLKLTRETMAAEAHAWANGRGFHI
jgi:GIY-YIG catalytic domain